MPTHRCKSKTAATRDIGLRNRFFFIILTTLIFAAIGINVVHAYFFKTQRLKLVDRQIAESSSALLASDDFKDSVKNTASVEEAISRVLGGSRIGKVFVLRDRNAKILYESFNVGLLKTDLPIEPEWVAVETKNEYVRVRNIPLPGPRTLVLQVGLVLDRNFLDWEIIDLRVINYVSGIVVALFLASVILTLLLLSPLRLLIAHLREATSHLVNLRNVRPLPMRLTRYTHGFWAKSDEFSSLLSTVQKLIDRINMNYKLTRSWTLQMAHELKTPLAIVRAETEAQRKSGLLPNHYASTVIKEVEQMSDIVSQFLEWAELESSQIQKDLHALRMKAVATAVAGRLDKIGPGRIRLELNFDFAVFANPIHLEQLISNLLSNALKFSPQTKNVDIIVAQNTLIIRDFGPGLPDEVKERIGEPFNVGSHEGSARTGSGLGLAWVFTVAKLYDWDFDIRKVLDGTEATVRFPLEEV